MQGAFSPQATATLSATSSSDRVALAGTGSQIVIQNAGPNVVFVQLGDSTVTAAVASGFPVFNGASVQISRAGHTHLAGICAATQTATVYATPGEGD